MSIATILEERFSGDAADDPITEAILRRFEKKWKRPVPLILRELLFQVNGVVFEPEVHWRHVPRVRFLSLHGIDSVLRAYGDYTFSFLIPFAASLTHGSFLLHARENNSEVYHQTPVVEDSPDRIVLKKVAVNLEEFVTELRQESRTSSSEPS